jgi:hypothetical protein
MFRRFAALAAILFCVAPAVAEPTVAAEVPQNIEFRVLLDGDDVGHHRVAFSASGEQIAADIESAFNVTMAGFTVFEFVQRSREVWQDGALQSVRASTTANDTTTTLVVDRVGDRLSIDGDKFKGEGPGTLIPASWWSPAILTQTQMLALSGEIVPISVANLGRETIDVAGAPLQTTRYAVKGRIEMNLWYDDQGKWVKSAFEIRGSQVEYVLQPAA